jgi:hypothetical protein
MTGDEVRQVFEAMRPQQEIDRLCKRFGVIERERRPQRLALPLAVSCQSIAQAFELEGAEAQQRWHKIAEWLMHAGRDPNWRRRPSILDQLRGWKRQPIARKEANSGNANHGHVKTAA